MIHTPHSLAELKEMRISIRNANRAHHDKLRPTEKLALFITRHIGSLDFFFIILTWTIIWIAWNSLAPSNWRFDPFPAFVLWLFISNMIQIFLMPLIMTGQNIQGKHAEERAEADFEVNIKAEREIETVLQHLENQNELILKILHRLENSDRKS